MGYKFEFRPYQRPFKRPLSTRYGRWEVREGIILRLMDETGQLSWGEIAPLSWFGSETLEQALHFCLQLSAEITEEMIFSIPAELPACQFGFESALNGFALGTAHTEAVQENTFTHQEPADNASLANLTYSGLLPAGEAALQQWQALWNQGYRTFKWKISVAPIYHEMEIFHQLIQDLPPSAQLRLDANGGLSWQEAEEWLQACDQVGVEFLEQPLPMDQFNPMLELSSQHSTPIALDESVATLEQLQMCYQLGWRGIFVIKPAIVGSPKCLRQFCQQHAIDTVFSSVFETRIGRQASLQQAAELSPLNRAVGFGIDHWFDGDHETWLEHLWQNL